jgi:SOS-response transcriptional repressor LexA
MFTYNRASALIPSASILERRIPMLTHLPAQETDQQKSLPITVVGRLSLKTPKASVVGVLGSVEAGFPSPAEEELVDTLSLDDLLIQNREATFLLKVSGDSMINAGILPGDMVIIDKGLTPKSGDIVIARLTASGP